MTAVVDLTVCREPEPMIDLATVRAFERGEIRLYSTTPHEPRRAYSAPCPDDRCPTRSIFLVTSPGEYEFRLAQHRAEVPHRPRGTTR